MSVVYILAAILIFGVLIAVHELGHFLAAKLCGVQVNEFSIGMGPALLKKTKGDTQYSLRLLPIGGFCAMEGEEEASDDPRAFNNQSVWHRLLILVAGAAAIGMGIAIAKALEGIARQPEADKKISKTLILGLVFLETCVIYALVVAILIIFVLG